MIGGMMRWVKCPICETSKKIGGKGTAFVCVNCKTMISVEGHVIAEGYKRNNEKEKENIIIQEEPEGMIEIE